MLSQTLLHCLFPLMTLFEALPNPVAFNPGRKICVWSSWQQKVNSGPRVRGQQQLGWHRVAEAVAGIHYISFRSSRVWSSILCVQRCSSLVDFSLSGRKQRVESYKSASTSWESSARESSCQPLPHTLPQRPLEQSAWLGAAGSSEVSWLGAALASDTAGAPSMATGHLWPEL